MNVIRGLGVLFLGYLLSACTTSPPAQTDNLCEIFEEKGWYKDARKAQKNWGSPIPVMMAMMHQESRFRADARPPRSKILWIFPGPRKSSAYGYPQAKNETWDHYMRDADRWGADRDDFADAIDFIGWYNKASNRHNKIKLSDTYHLYLAYHEGQGGFARRTFRNKQWLKDVAKKVSARAHSYQRQLTGCEKRLQRSRWWPF